MPAKRTGRKTRNREPKGLVKGTPIPMANGGTLIAGAGRGPAKGAPNAGRPPDEWKRALQALADRQAVLDHIDKALLDGPRRPKLDESGNPVKDEYEGSDFFERALDYVTDHGYGKAMQPIAHSGSLSLADLLTTPRTDPTA